MPVGAAVISGLGAVVAALIGSSSSSSTSNDQLIAAKQAQWLDFQLANQKRADTLAATKEQMAFNRQALSQQKKLTLTQLGQQQKQFQQTQIGNELQNRLNYFNYMIKGQTQLQNNLANLWRRG
jgi:hypothetical protein